MLQTIYFYSTYIVAKVVAEIPFTPGHEMVGEVMNTTDVVIITFI